ncbi:MAG: helix-turn-helix domain-containing protein [Planctomycetota bacterium]
MQDNQAEHSPPLKDILRVTARYHQVPLRVLTSASRKQAVVTARAIAIYLARELTPLSYAQIGQALGGRDHTTIMHNYRRIAREMPRDLALKSAIEELHRLLAR